MAEIDFLPAEYWKRRASQRDQWYLLGIGLASLVLLLASVVHESGIAAGLRAQLKSVESEYKDALVQVEEVKKLEQRRAPPAFDAKFYSLLRARPSVSRALVALATSCPTHVTLHAIRAKTIIVTRPEDKLPGTSSRLPATTSNSSPVDVQQEQLERFAAQRELTRLTIELDGIAESDLAVAELLERLENAGCFAEVKLDTSADSPTPGASDLRQFKIQCRLLEVF